MSVLLDALLSLPALIGLVVAALVVAFVFWNRRPLPLFIPPKMHPLVVRLAHLLLPWRLCFTDKVLHVEIDAESLARLRALEGQRAVLCPNHSYRADADIIMELSRRMGRPWFILSALENFLPHIQGWFLQHVGVYSIIRGTLDKASFRMTRQILAEGERWLVLFPEGETCGLNESVGPFLPGVAQFGFWALEDLAAKGEAVPPLRLVPVALKYLVMADVRPAITRALTRLEKKLGITQPAAELYPRLVAVGEAVLRATEREYGLRPAKDALFNDRMQAAKAAIIARVATELGIAPRADQPMLEQIRGLFNALDRQMREEPAESDYARQLQEQHRRHAKELYNDLWRVMRFVAIYDSYVAETMTLERFCELINRLEWEVFGTMRWIGPLKAVLQVGEPIDLADHWPAYQQDKRAALAAVMSLLEGRVRGMMTDLTQRSTPVG
jgi:1-acyl-sn-glycerol-3-phosphate acyltransferase